MQMSANRKEKKLKTKAPRDGDSAVPPLIPTAKRQNSSNNASILHVVSFSKPNGDYKKNIFFLSSKRGSSFVSGPSSVERGK